MSDPAIEVPREYNAAAALLEGNLAAGRGAKVAVRDGFGAHTYAELAARVERTAAALQAIGVEPEQRVLLCLLDTIDFHACFLGAMRIGAVPVPVNTMLTTADFEHMLVDSRARVLVVSDALVEKVAPAAARSPFLRRVVVAPSPLGGDAAGFDRLEALVAAAPAACAPARTTCDDVAFWLYSSGSTGRPKGAMHLHASLPRTAALYARGVLGLREDDVVAQRREALLRVRARQRAHLPARGRRDERAPRREADAARDHERARRAPADRVLRRAHALRVDPRRREARAQGGLARAPRVHVRGRGAAEARR